LIGYVSDGRIEIDNNAAERSLRAVALGRNYPRLTIRQSTKSRGTSKAADRVLRFA